MSPINDIQVRCKTWIFGECLSKCPPDKTPSCFVTYRSESYIPIPDEPLEISATNEKVFERIAVALEKIAEIMSYKVTYKPNEVITDEDIIRVLGEKA